MAVHRFFVLALLLTGCVVGAEDDADLPDGEEGAGEPELGQLEAAGVPGINGIRCKASPYNCRFRDGSSRVTAASGSESWGIEPGASVRDGNGDVLGVETRTRMTFNYGQTRLLAGKAHALGLSTSNGSAGWYPIDRILGEASFRAHNGNVDAKNPGLGEMACYEIRDSHDASIELRKVVKDSASGENGHERAGDYQSLVRANGRRSANLTFNVPGFGLGGTTTDHFPAGTKFQRVEVPTSTGRPSIEIPLWSKNGGGRYLRRNGSLLFLYGYIRAEDGVRRYGWMAREALKVSSSCP